MFGGPDRWGGCFKQTKDSETQGEGGLRIVLSEEAAEHPRRSPGGRWGYCYTELLGEAWFGRKHLGTWVWKYIYKGGCRKIEIQGDRRAEEEETQ